ncbi:nitrate reductase [Jiella marina]|uniref:nitrate reductase n=1 Tax=Jiella sp. LLJ827 TaxID=2917712 RepID=UPI0021008BC5|nr:nitrate reductase [Jiella sp. LLJ827]MCQ0988818.1 nitrate reductase [Jiella sp. LLJ827]
MEHAAPAASRRSEFTAFFILAFLIVPALVVAGIGGLGLAIWIFNLVNGVVEAPPEAG